MNKYFVPDSAIDRMAIEETARKHGVLVIPISIDRDYILAEAEELGLDDRILVKYWHEQIYGLGPCVYLYADEILRDTLDAMEWDKSSMFMVSD